MTTPRRFTQNRVSRYHPLIATGSLATMSHATHHQEATLPDRLFALLLHLLPHHLLSSAIHWLTRSQWRPLKNQLISTAISLYKIDMEQAEENNPLNYPSFNHFFTRALRPGARPLAEETAAVACPVDGAVSQCGRIDSGRIFQAKGIDFSLEELLGGERDWSARFLDGSFATIYLSPRDYHRVHMPLAGKLKKMLHVPGRLFSVSPSTTRTLPRLFCRNERVISLFETPAGPMAVIMVGAIFVASMETVWAGTVTPATRRVSEWRYGKKPPRGTTLERGAEMGRFNMGSTVILLFGPDAVEWQERLQPGTRVLMGEAIAQPTKPDSPE